MSKLKSTPGGDSFAEIRAILADVARKQAETDRIIKANAVQMAETDRIVKANAVQQAANAVQQAETDRMMKAMSSELGGIGESNGEIFEIEAADAVKEAQKVGDIALDAITEDVHSVAGNQFDIVGINGKFIVLMEVKQTLGANDISRLAEDAIPAFIKDFPGEVKGKAVKGALIYRRIGGKASNRKDIARKAFSRGIILMRAVGKNKLYHIKTPAEVSVPARQLKPYSAK